MLMGTDLELSALEMIAVYGDRFTIEVAFKQALHTLSTSADHFWMRAMTPQPRRSGNQYLHRKPADYRQQVQHQLAALPSLRAAWLHRPRTAALSGARLSGSGVDTLQERVAHHEAGTTALRGGGGTGATQDLAGISLAQP